MNLGRYISRSARFWPEKTAVIHRDKRYTFLELDERTNRLSQGLLSIGLKPGDHVAVQAWNCSEIIEVESSCYKAGFVKVPVNARLSAEETIHVLNDSEAKAAIVDRDHVGGILENRSEIPLLKYILCMEDGHADAIGYEGLIAGGLNEMPEVEVKEDDIAVLHYTSGTSGVLKAAMQTFGNRLSHLCKYLMSPREKLNCEDQVFCLIGPVTHATGMNIFPVLYTGGTLLVMDNFDLETLLPAISKEKVTHMFMVPTMINKLLDYPKLLDYDLSSLRNVTYGASPMSPARVREAIEKLGPILSQGYGAGETTSLVTVLTIQDHIEAIESHPERLSSCGRCFFGTDLRVVDENHEEVAVGELGEIVVRGPDVMKGYWRSPELTAEVLKDGWYYTGDLAKIDDEGFIYIVDRKKEMIISGGFNIYPSEVENVLYSHPSVHEACVVGIPDDTWGESVKALVVLKDGQTPTESDLIEHCKKHLAGFKKPKSIDFVDELPKNPNGKIVRKLAKEKFWVGMDRQV